MKKMLTLLIILLMANMLYAETLPQMPFGWVDGNGGNISNLAELRWLSETTDAWDEAWVLTTNIDAEETKTWNTDGGTGYYGFSPIGNTGRTFTGSFNGQGHAISKLYINRTATGRIGLFGYTSSATISNTGIIDCNIKGQNGVGGLVGRNKNSTVSTCYSTGSVTGRVNVGGLVGESEVVSTVSTCYSTGSVTGGSSVGGLVGYNFSSTVNYCYATGARNGNREFCRRFYWL